MGFWPIRESAVSYLYYKTEYDAILDQWVRKNVYNHLSNYTKYLYFVSRILLVY